MTDSVSLLKTYCEVKLGIPLKDDDIIYVNEAVTGGFQAELRLKRFDELAVRGHVGPTVQEAEEAAAQIVLDHFKVNPIELIAKAIEVRKEAREAEARIPAWKKARLNPPERELPTDPRWIAAQQPNSNWVDPNADHCQAPYSSYQKCPQGSDAPKSKLNFIVKKWAGRDLTKKELMYEVEKIAGVGWQARCSFEFQCGEWSGYRFIGEICLKRQDAEHAAAQRALDQIATGKPPGKGAKRIWDLDDEK